MYTLKQLKRDYTHKMNNPFYVCDIEAHKWKEFRVIGLYDGTKFMEFRSLEAFFEHLFSDNESKNIYAHFGGIYDFMFLLKHIVFKSKTKIDIINLVPRGSGILCFDVINRERKIKLKFTDSSALLPFSLEKLTKSFNVEHKKKKFDFDKWDGIVTDEMIEYLEADCRGLYEVLQRFHAWPLIAKAGKKTTMASQSLRVFQTFLENDIPSLRKNVDSFVRKAYFGGRTEIFKPYFSAGSQSYEHLKTYDVNSLYPSVMLDNDFPTRCQGRSYFYDPSQMGVWLVDVDVPEMYVPPLGSVIMVPSNYSHKNKKCVEIRQRETAKFIFPTGRFTGYWTTSEIEYARQLGVKIRKIHFGYTFANGGKIFKQYIETLYEMRMKARADGDGVTDVICKLLMNSLYGRFGMNPDKENLSFDQLEDSEIYTFLENNRCKIPIFKNKVTLKTFFNVAISCFVTSYSRIAMHKHYMLCENDIWYTDTDSLFTTKNFDNNNNLGSLKLEYESKRACFLLPKTYATEKITDNMEVVKKICMKGFDNKLAQKFTLDDFKNALEGEVGVLRLTNPSKLARFRTALRKKDFLTMMEEQERQIKSYYDKRKVYRTSSGFFDSSPLHIKDEKVVNL